MEALASLIVFAACIGVGWVLMHLRRRVGRVERGHEDHGERLQQVEEKQREHQEVVEPLRRLAEVLDGKIDGEKPREEERERPEVEGPRSARRDRALR